MFLLDANVFMEASRTYYSEALAPAYWTWVAAQHAAGNLASIAAVRNEIDDGRGAGHLKKWAKSLPPTFWVQPTQPSVTAMAVLSAWTMDPTRTYTAAARRAFLQEADYLLISEALGGGHVVVTREKSSPEAKKRVLIPDACAGVGVECREPFKVYEHLGLCLS